MKSTPLIYEVNLAIDPHIAEEHDEWLQEHVEAMLDFDGFDAVVILDNDEKSKDGRIQRCVQYHVRDREALDEYLQHHARGMRAAGVEKFGAQFSAERRILETDRHLDADSLKEMAECQNCSSPITGQYCSNCGQRSRVRLITMWELFRDLFADLFEFDSRLWRTLIPLLCRPGKLTRAYLNGRRMRYVPPFRMYLILSIIFFLLTTAGADLNFDDVVIDGDSQKFDEAIQEVEKEIAETTDPDEIANLQTQLAAIHTARNLIGSDDDDQSGEEAPETPDPSDAEEESGEGHVRVQFDAPTEDESRSFADSCDKLEISLGNKWIEEKIGGEERLRAVCRKMAEDNFSNFVRALLDNLPKMMFLFLPLLAIVMKILYLFSRRYYVEHLLFYVHYHAFFFLLMTLAILAGKLSDLVAAPEWVMDIVAIVCLVYIPIYLYKSMRRVYQQGHFLTITKFIVLNVAYFFSLMMMITLTALITALTL